MKGKKIKMIIIISSSIILVAIFLARHWIPAKYSVKNNEFDRYKNYILVKETYHTGTKWEKIGDEKGFCEIANINDIKLTGKRLPRSKVGHNINIFLCIVEYRGRVKHAAFEEFVDSYEVKEWYPVYPVVRNAMWPSWLLPSDFMNKEDTIEY